MAGQPPLLSGLSSAEQQELLASAQPRLLPVRGVLGEQGAPAEVLALVQVGHLKLSRVNEAGAETLVRFVGPGDCYGAIVLRPDSRYPVSATAVQPSRVLVWPRRFVTDFAGRVPRLRANLFDEVTRRMSAMLETAQELAAKAQAYQVPSNKDAVAPPEAPDLSQIELIDYDIKKFGSSEERTRLLKKWDEEVYALPR